MQQRRLRLGDILDDYCPRERRITNHVIVAMIEDDIRQTRCTTCDAEHEYKQAKMPTLRRKKDSVTKAYQDVLTAVTTDTTMQAAQAAASPSEGPGRPGEMEQPRLPEAPPLVAEERSETTERVEAAEEIDSRDAVENGADDQLDDQGRVHRRLIRAQLPRPENQPPARPIPEFTMRQPQGRSAGKFRGGGGRGPVVGRAGAPGRNGSHPGASSRPAGFRAGAGRAQGARNDFHRPTRGGQGQPARHGKKHSK